MSTPAVYAYATTPIAPLEWEQPGSRARTSDTIGQVLAELPDGR